VSFFDSLMGFTHIENRRQFISIVVKLVSTLVRLVVPASSPLPQPMSFAITNPRAASYTSLEPSVFEIAIKLSFTSLGCVSLGQAVLCRFFLETCMPQMHTSQLCVCVFNSLFLCSLSKKKTM